jgi:D-sedoheptulose 7-phosphate isomerase
MEVWALTGPGPTPLQSLAHEAISLNGTSTATVQELHMIALHMVCAAVDREVALHREREQAPGSPRPAVGLNQRDEALQHV